MPIIYLSPSTQENNLYVNGGTEEEWMNRLADAMEPILFASGIQYTRNDRDQTAAAAIRASNAGNYDLHLALHSNASGPGAGGQSRGILAFYYPTSANGRRAAELFVENLRDIYPLPEKVSTRATTSLGEIRQPRFPSVLLELGYHDNPEDAAWIKSSLDAVAKNLVISLTDYFDIPFLLPQPSRSGQVDVDWGVLNIRARPELDAPILVQAPDGAPLTVRNSTGDWYLVDYYGTVGYARQDFITLI